MSNTYDNPEDFGLEIVKTLDQPDLRYEFNMLVIWKSKEGKLFYAEDSGRSYPSPFDHFNDMEGLTEITKANFDVFTKSVNDFPVPEDEKHQTIEHIKTLLS